MTQISWKSNNGEAVAKFLGGEDGRNSEVRFKCVQGGGVGKPTFIDEDPIKGKN